MGGKEPTSCVFVRDWTQRQVSQNQQGEGGEREREREGEGEGIVLEGASLVETNLDQLRRGGFWELTMEDLGLV